MLTAMGRTIKRQRGPAALAAGLALLLLISPNSPAQVIVGERLFAPVAVDTSGDDDFAGGAALKTDPELEQYLKKADEYAADGRYDLATKLWQRALDESTGTVVARQTQKTQRGNTYRCYRSVTSEIEQTIAKLPPKGLRGYRLSADGEAKALLAEAVGDKQEEALAQVAARYFLSSLGDDAAYRLACLRMDRYEFVGASRLIAKILEEYPDTNIPRDDLLLRLVVASARVGDRQTVQRTWQELKASSTVLSPRLLARIEADITREGIDSPRLADALRDWTMAYGNPARTGHMPALPGTLTSATMSELWTAPFAVTPRDRSANDRDYLVFDDWEMLQQHKTVGETTSADSAPNAELISRWRERGWAPAGEVLLHRGLVYYKSSGRVICRNLRTGELAWMGRRNKYQLDAASQLYMQQRGQRSKQPQTLLDAQIFADRIHPGMTIADGWLFNIEGPRDDDFYRPPPTPQRGIRNRYGYGMAVTRARRNYMSAYDAANGKLKWYRSAAGDGAAGDGAAGDGAAGGGSAGEGEGGKFDVGFLAAPVPFARFLLVPVVDGGSLWVYALEKKTGKTAWKSFLCDDPPSGASPFSPVALAVDGGDAYVSTGSGVVFAIDALNGSTRWGVRYQRSGYRGGNMQQYRNPYQMLGRIDGWREDMVIPHGKHLVVMASDSDELFALDRRTGELLWDSPRTPYGDQRVPGEYCLGVVGDGLFVGGKNIVRRYDIPGGRLLWEANLEVSLGRGAVTEDAVYVPENSTIVRLDLEGGKRLAQVAVASGIADSPPIGNLSTDGKRLVSLGLGRISVLTDTSYRLDLLAEQIKDGDVAAQLERMRLRLAKKDHAGALEDLRGAYQLLLARRQTEQAVAAMCAGLDELGLASGDPQTALQLIAQMPTSLPTSSPRREFAPEILARRSELLTSALQQIEKNKVRGAAREVLGVVPLCSEDYLIRAARSAMSATASPDDAQVLREALTSPRFGVRTVALAGLPGALGDEAGEALQGLLKDSSDRIKLEAAWTLANSGAREALPALGELLDSDDVDVRARSVRALRSLSGETFKYSAYDPAARRADAAQAWRDWIAGAGQTAKLRFPIREGSTLIGRTLICYYSQNKVVELDANGDQVWEAKIPYAWGCQGLPNGHRIVASYSGRFVAEYDAQGKEVWKKIGLPGAPFSVRRLENGNTLVTCSDSRKVIEITPDKEIAWEIEIKGRPMDARRLDNGNTLIALQTDNRVVEADREGNIVWEAAKQVGVCSASRLENGNTLICQQAANVVVEVSRDGEAVWMKDGLKNPYDAQRLPNGNTLIVDHNGVHEIDPKGNTVWERNGTGASRVHRY